MLSTYAQKPRRYVMAVICFVVFSFLLWFGLKISHLANNISSALEAGSLIYSLGKKLQDDGGIQQILEKHPVIFKTAKHLYAEVVDDLVPKLLIQDSTGAFRPLIWDISTHNEFTFIWNHLQERKESHPHLASPGIVVEVGGGSGIGGSNSFNFIQQGWRGLIIEPFPDNAAALREQLHKYELAVVEECAIDDHDGTAPLYFFPGESSKTSNCLDCYDSNQLKEMWGTYTTVDVAVYKVATVMKKHAIPQHFAVLSIDAEGKDLEVLEQFFNARYFPMYVIIEVYQSHRSNSAESIMHKHKYKQLHQVGSVTNINKIYTRQL